MTDVLGICLAVGVFHIHHLLKKQAVPCGAACRSLRYELLMLLFAFEVNDAQGHLHLQVQLWRFWHT